MSDWLSHCICVRFARNTCIRLTNIYYVFLTDSLLFIPNIFKLYFKLRVRLVNKDFLLSLHAKLSAGQCVFFLYVKLPKSERKCRCFNLLPVFVSESLNWEVLLLQGNVWNGWNNWFLWKIGKNKICIGCVEFGTALVLPQGRSVPYADTHAYSRNW